MQTENKNSLAAKVFQNELILAKIIFHRLLVCEEIDYDANGRGDYDQCRHSYKWRTFLKLRLVNKKFNSACLAELRITFRHLVIADYSAVDPDEPVDPYEETSINFNSLGLPFSMTAGCLRFLQTVARVTVKSLEINCWMGLYSGDNYKIELHQVIAEHLDLTNCDWIIGMEDLCQLGCDWCTELAQKCRVWSPMQLDALQSAPWEQPVHYEKLEVSEFLICEIADLCSEKNSKEECQAELELLITSSITCDYLIFHLFKSEKYLNYTYRNLLVSKNPHRHSPLPFEVLAQMLATWQPKRVKFRFQYQKPSADYEASNSWSSTGMFTNFRLDSPVEKNNWSQLPRRVDLVEIEAETIDFIKEEIGQTTFDDDDTSECSFENLVANVGRLIPCNRMFLGIESATQLNQSPREILLFGMWTNGVLDSILKNHQRNLDVIIPVFPLANVPPNMMDNIETPDILGSGACLVNSDSQWKLLEVTKIACKYHFSWWHPSEFRGQCFKVRNEEANVNVNFEIFVRDEDLRAYFGGRTSLENTGFMRHFWHDFNLLGS